MPIILEADEETNIKFHEDNVRLAKEWLEEETERARQIIAEARYNLLEAYDWAREEGVFIK